MVVGEFTTETELVVIGGGPGGYSAALRAAELGIETTIVDDREHLGGAWLHDGCVLSKNLVQIADVVRCAQHAASYGVMFEPPRFDLDLVRQALTTTVDEITRDLDAACRASGITRVHGEARFDDSRQLSVHGATSARLRFRRAIIATGSRTPELEGVTADSPRIMSTRRALSVPEVPKSLLISGGSTCAIEIAGVYTALGSAVTLAVASDRLAPVADDDLVHAMLAHVGPTLAALYTNVKITSVTDNGNGLDVVFASTAVPSAPPAPGPATFDALLHIPSRLANVGGLDLERTKVMLNDEGFIGVDDRLQTTDPRILAVGDVTGEPLLAQRAMHQGRVAAEAVAGWGSIFDARAAPMVVFTVPPIAWCGLTEREAAARGQSVRVSKTAGIAGQPTDVAAPNGFTKIIYDPDTSLVLGVGVAGPGAPEMIAEGALAVEMGAVTADLAATLHPHPTRSEALARAAQNTLKE